MTYYVGGYYLVEGTPIQKFMDGNILPYKIWSVSDCISGLHPEYVTLTRVSADAEEIKDYRTKLGLTEEQFSQLQQEVDDLLAGNALGWGKVFLNADSARTFYKKHLSHISDIKLLAIATTENHRKTFLEDEEPFENYLASGVFQCLQLATTINIEDGFRGFEVLGHNSGEVHSFNCFSTEEYFRDELKIEFNEQGLIRTLMEAEKGSEYLSNPDVAGERGYWMPWAILELPLDP